MLETRYTYEDFDPHAGSDFTVVHAGDTEIILTLLEAIPLKNHGAQEVRPPFGLLFQSAYQEVMPQQLFTLRHETMGDLGIFLVPSARNDTGIQYYATFN